jgi:SAM-dependent methyltransferase
MVNEALLTGAAGPVTFLAIVPEVRTARKENGVMALVGWVETCTTEGITGWATDTTLPNQPVAVDVYVGPRRAERVLADLYRSDLQAAGYGNGRKAFFCKLPPSALAAATPVEVQVCFADTLEVVPNGSFQLQAAAAAEEAPLAAAGEAVPEGADREANPWNAEMPYDYTTSWIGCDVCSDNINRTISGDPKVAPLTYFFNEYMRSRGVEALHDCRALLLGASEGNMERDLRRLGFTGPIVATDIAGNALERARLRSEALGYGNIRYVVHNLNDPFGDRFGGPFDFIFAEGVLHHIANIGPCLAECNRLLRDDGRMFAVEFEGPFRFQLPDMQVRWINAALSILPRGLSPKTNSKTAEYPATAEDDGRARYVIPSEEAIARIDPSEALTGPELKRLIPETFEVVERKGVGGTLLSYMTEHVDFRRAKRETHVTRWVKVLMEIEHALIDTDILEDEFVFYVLKKKTA